jgi:glycosyltransferase involved in cell wall biosynthesis
LLLLKDNKEGMQNITLGLHYHIPFSVKDGEIYTAGYFGVFVDSLASEVNKLVILGYIATPKELEKATYKLRSGNIQFVSLGLHNALYLRYLRAPIAWKVINKTAATVDAFLVRAPTPLLPLFYFLSKKSNVIQYLVGSYIAGSRDYKGNFLKGSLIKAMGYFVENTQRKFAKRGWTFVNSRKLYNEYLEFSNKIVEIKTTTIQRKDLFYKQPLENTGVNKLLFTGRVDPAKGLDDIIDACAILTREGFKLEFHYAGMIVKGLEDYPQQLVERGVSQGFKSVFFHGMKTIGKELNQLYRTCDIYVIPTKFEGFPRTIWEAMANSLPVIAGAVGSIPFFLENEENALLIPHSDVDALANALRRILTDAGLKKKLVENAYAVAAENTLENQSARLVTSVVHAIKN